MYRFREYKLWHLKVKNPGRNVSQALAISLKYENKVTVLKKFPFMKVQNNLKLISILGGEVTRYPFVSFSREKARGSSPPPLPPQHFLYTLAITQARTLKNN